MRLIVKWLGFMNEKRIGILSDVGLLILRLGFGFTMLYFYGLKKVMNFGAVAEVFPDPFGWGANLGLFLTIFAEVICSVLLMLGFATRFILIPLIGSMAIAIFYVDGGRSLVAIETDIYFLTAFVALFLAGPGRFSFDGHIRSKYSRPSIFG